ncbi:MAG: PHP domain-containing protein [Intestinimonas sp.]
MSEKEGARGIKLHFDFHFHSCLSPCGDEAMTPATIAGMCKLSGLDAAALTDHNTCGNCAAFADRRGLRAAGPAGRGAVHAGGGPYSVRIPGPGAGRRLSGGGVPQPGGGPQRPGYFRPSALSGRRRPCAGRGPRLLAGATAIGVYEVPALVERYGGAAWPAHIDRSSFSLLSNLGLWDPGLGFSLAEVSRDCP